jgi:DNA polymerase-3 subunit epsilon
MFVSWIIMVIEQSSRDQLGVPLAEVTFCVVDLETTGGDPDDCAITEIGAVKTRRGEVLGTFQTLVDPGEPVPPLIQGITGIDDQMVRGAPSIRSVLPTFLEFIKGCALVAHSAAFDVGFLQRACYRAGYEGLENPVVDTALLARRLLIEEVPNRKLSTVAAYFTCEHQPRHRAYDDALATVDVLHHLIERGTGFGVMTLADLLGFCSASIREIYDEPTRR